MLDLMQKTDRSEVLAQDRVQWWDSLNKLMHLWVPYM